jgi:hypothetical protein
MNPTTFAALCALFAAPLQAQFISTFSDTMAIAGVGKEVLGASLRKTEEAERKKQIDLKNAAAAAAAANQTDVKAPPKKDDQETIQMRTMVRPPGAFDGKKEDLLNLSGISHSHFPLKTPNLMRNRRYDRIRISCSRAQRYFCQAIPCESRRHKIRS